MEYRTVSQTCGRLYLPNIFVQDRVVYSYIYRFFHGPSYIVLLPAYKFIVLHWCCVLPVVLWGSNIREGAFKCSPYLSPKVSGWLPYVLILTFNLVTLKPVYDIAFLGDCVLVLWWYQERFIFPLSAIVFHTCYRCFCTFHKVLVNVALLCGTPFQNGGCWILPFVSIFVWAMFVVFLCCKNIILFLWDSIRTLITIKCFDSCFSVIA